MDFAHRPAHRSDRFYGDNGRSDVLGNCSDFGTDNRGPAYTVQKRGLPVINMPHDADNRRPDLRVLRHIPSPLVLRSDAEDKIPNSRCTIK